MSENNLWVKEYKDEIVVGLTDKALDELGSINFVSLPKVNTAIEAQKNELEIEAEKAIIEYESPVSGIVTAINETITQTTEDLNQENAWLYKVKK